MLSSFGSGQGCLGLYHMPFARFQQSEGLWVGRKRALPSFIVFALVANIIGNCGVYSYKCVGWQLTNVRDRLRPPS